MKKILCALLLATALTSAYSQTITIDFTVGVLANGSGTAVSDNSLIQVVASSDTTFESVTPGAFVAGDDAVVWSGAFDSSTTGLTGAMVINISGLSATYAGDYLLVRWFPDLTTSSSTPGITSYGQFGYPTDVSWVAPAAGGTSSYSFTTTSASGSYADSMGYASLMTAVPEPSTYALLAGLAMLGFVWVRRRVARA